jgi:hypothetical protein
MVYCSLVVWTPVWVSHSISAFVFSPHIDELVAAVTKRIQARTGVTTPLISLSIGLKGQSPDLVAAKYDFHF